jgi:carboxymethylenebutenolidase
MAVDTTPLSVHHPAGDRRGGVVVVQEAFGVNPHIESVCARFAAEGWLAVAPHLFHRTGDPQLPYGDFDLVMPHMQALTRDGIVGDVDAALARLQEEGVAMGATGIVGFCMGGSVALHVACERSVGAAVTFYGGGVAKGRFGLPSQLEVAPSLRAPWLGLYGDLDESIPVAEVEQLRDAAASSGQPTDVVRYAGAGHGFHCDVRDSYEPAAAADAWRRTLDWFERHLVAEGASTGAG